MRIVEKCSCGASTEIETADAKLAQRLVEKWRRAHNHTKSYEWPTRWEKPVPYWPNTITWTSGTTGGGRGTSTITYSGTTSAVTGSSPSNRTQGED